MSLKFASICPHPPLLVPEIGREDTTKVTQTVSAMKKLAQIFGNAEIDTLIIISPHSLVYPDRFNISAMSKSFGSFNQFGEPNIKFEHNNDLELVEKILTESNKDEIPVLAYDNNENFFESDHGIMVPLYYLEQEQNFGLKVIPIAYSWLNRAQHFAFGKALAEVIKKSPQRIGIVASGDLSHRLFHGSTGDNPDAGKNFDQKLIEDLKQNNFEEILLYDEEFVENAGECGYRSIITLLGALDQTKTEAEVLSYEGPFGVGYAVVNFKLEETD